MRENTLQAEDKGFESAEAVYTYYEMVPKNVPNALMRHTNTDCRASRFKAYVKCIRTPSPRRKIAGDLSKHGERKIHTV